MRSSGAPGHVENPAAEDNGSRCEKKGHQTLSFLGKSAAVVSIIGTGVMVYSLFYDRISDPLTALLRSGAQQLINQAVEAELLGLAKDTPFGHIVQAVGQIISIPQLSGITPTSGCDFWEGQKIAEAVEKLTDDWFASS